MKHKSTRDAYGETLEKVGNDFDIVVLDADLSISTKTSLFGKKYPDRFFDVGCAEQNLIGVAAGFALSGNVTFASTYAIFVTRAWEQIRNTLAHDNLNVKIAVTHAGLTNAQDGASHQSVEDIAIMRSIPNMRVISPADAVETEKVILYEIDTPGPAYIRLNREPTPVLFDDSYKYIPGKATILSEGSDLAICATGSMVHTAIEAANLLKKEQISATVVDVHTIKPIDIVTIRKIAESCGRIITVEEHSRFGGLGSAIAEVIVDQYPIPVRILGINDTFGSSGGYRELLEMYGLTAENIVKSSKELCEVRL